MKSFNLFALLLTLTISSVSPALADNALLERVVSGLSENGGWDKINAELITKKMEVSFALHDSVGTLDSRIKNLRLLAGNLPAQILAVHHPGYLDAFLSDPDGYVRAMKVIGGDQDRKEYVLAALLRRPTPEGLKDSRDLLSLYGRDLARLSSEPGFLDLFEALSWVADDAPPELADWLGRRLKEMRLQDIGFMTELLLMHRTDLRDRANAKFLEKGWDVLQRARRGNRELANLILEHRKLWPMLQERGFVDAMAVQERHNLDQARAVLIFLLGQQGAMYDVLDDLNWSEPLPVDYRPSAFSIIADNDESTMVAMFHWRESPEFWSFVADTDKRAYIPCLLNKSNTGPAGLRSWWAWETSALDKTCESGPSILLRSIPLYSVYDVGSKMIAGVPLDWGDAANLGFESMSLVTVAKAAGLFGRTAVKVARIANEAGSPATSTMVAASHRTTADSTAAMVRNVVSKGIKLDRSRIVRTESRVGIGRALGIDTGDVVRSLSAKPGGQPAMVLAMEHGMNMSGELAVERAISTEFFRCAALLVQQFNDEICNTFSGVLAERASP